MASVAIGKYKLSKERKMTALLRRFAACFTVESHVIDHGRKIRKLSNLGPVFLWLMCVIVLAVWR